MVVGAGVRAALEVGAHRKRMYSPTPNVEEELWRRAFWYVLRLSTVRNITVTFRPFLRILLLLEWMLGYGFGRPCSIHDEE